MDEAIKFIREIGFPVAVAAYVLTRLERAVAELRLELFRIRLTLSRMGVHLADDDDHAPKP